MKNDVKLPEEELARPKQSLFRLSQTKTNGVLALVKQALSLPTLFKRMAQATQETPRRGRYGGKTRWDHQRGRYGKAIAKRRRLRDIAHVSRKFNQAMARAK